MNGALQAIQEQAVEQGADVTETMEKTEDFGVPSVSLSTVNSKISASTADGAETGFDIYAVEDLEDYQTPQNHVIAGNGIIRRKGGTVFTGGTGLGKSVAAIDIAVWLAGGKPLFGCIQVPAAVPVLYLGAENDPDTLKRDVMAAMKHSAADKSTVCAHLTIEHVWGLNGAAFTAHLERQVAAKEPAVVIVDPYQAFVEPGDLNATASFLKWIGPIQALMHRTNFGLILVAHTPKPRDRSDWNTREMVYAAAGTSAIANWARCSMELMPAQHEVDRFRLTFGKNAERNGLTDAHGHTTRELYLQHSGNIEEPYWTVADNQEAPSRSKYAEKIIEIATAHPSFSYDEIAKQVGCAKGTVATHYPKELN